ncbi:hypothetical protein [Marinomonas primoryensis]|uniref:hypothetical protein n=1 Tax=Marinomonas primoryensis TaxID=178399 RepID=UPI0013AF7B8F|nr:hypothetical protein [Marinomonas primoryensis]
MKKTNIKAKKDALPDNVDELKQLILTAQSLAEKQRDHIRRLAIQGVRVVDFRI